MLNKALYYFVSILVTFHVACKAANPVDSLLSALESDNIAIVKAIIKDNPKFLDSYNGEIPLLIYGVRGHKDIAAYIISSGADVNKGTPSGWTPLHEAIQTNDVDRVNIVNLLIAKGADVNAKGNTVRISGLTPLHCAVAQNDIEVARILLSHGAKPNITCDDGTSPLHWAATYGCIDIARLLITNGANVNARNINGRTPLHSAVLSNDPAIVKALITEGADINSKSKYGDTPLTLAIGKNNGPLVRLLKDYGKK